VKSRKDETNTSYGGTIRLKEAHEKLRTKVGCSSLLFGVVLLDDNDLLDLRLLLGALSFLLGVTDSVHGDVLGLDGHGFGAELIRHLLLLALVLGFDGDGGRFRGVRFRLLTFGVVTLRLFFSLLFLLSFELFDWCWRLLRLPVLGGAGVESLPVGKRGLDLHLSFVSLLRFLLGGGGLARASEDALLNVNKGFAGPELVWLSVLLFNSGAGRAEAHLARTGAGAGDEEDVVAMHRVLSGVQVTSVDDAVEELVEGVHDGVDYAGVLCLTIPVGFALVAGLVGDDVKFLQGPLQRCNGLWFSSGDVVGRGQVVRK
jgi:hypothetical protein